MKENLRLNPLVHDDAAGARDPWDICTLDDCVRVLTELVKVLDELEAIAVFACVANEVQRMNNGPSLDAEGLYGADWEPLAAAAMHRIRTIATSGACGNVHSVLDVVIGAAFDRRARKGDAA